ncbi:MAG: TerC family protein [Candidatus Rokuibacteriota bacterium]|nr:MAG: TerC family protein [Candidatus Rokubacteria bacterium]
MSVFLTADGLVALFTLTALEIVLGIDNVVFISIISARLPLAQQALARKLGLGLALATRLLLLFTISWMMGLTRPLFRAPFAGEVSGRDLILLVGGLFLIAKATWEIYDKVEVGEGPHLAGGGRRSFLSVVLQILLLDMIFSLDSVITAVGMVNELPIMVAAIVIAMGVMLFAMEPVNGFIESHPSMKILALAFLILIGVLLVADGLGQHVPKGYIYFAMAFSLGVEVLNIRYHRRRPRARAS